MKSVPRRNYLRGAVSHGGLSAFATVNATDFLPEAEFGKHGAANVNEAEFIEAALRNPINREIVKRLGSLQLNDAWLVAGALFQSAWNAISGREPEYGIKDYDIFYFDPDLSWEAEDAAIRRGADLFGDLKRRIEIRNQVRVHIWYEEKFGALHIQRCLARPRELIGS